MPPDSEECLLEDLTDAGGLGSFELLDDRPAALRPPDVSGRNLSVKGSIVRYVLYAVSALSVGVVVTWAFRGPIVSSDSKDDTLDTIRNFSNDSVVSTAPPTHTTMAMNSSSNSVIEVRSVTAASSGVSSVVTQALRSTSIPTQSHVQATSTTTVPAVMRLLRTLQVRQTAQFLHFLLFKSQRKSPAPQQVQRPQACHLPQHLAHHRT